MPVPNGFLCFGPSSFVSAAFILSLFSTSLCNFLILDEDNERRENLNIDKIGFWCYENTFGTRIAMTELTTLDPELERARKFGLTANVFACCVWLIYLFAGCKKFSPKIFMIGGFFCYIACFFEGFKFWILRSKFFCAENPASTLGCTLDVGGNCSIAALVLWFVAGKLICAHTKERMMDEAANGGAVGEDDNEGEKEPEGAPAAASVEETA